MVMQETGPGCPFPLPQRKELYPSARRQQSQLCKVAGTVSDQVKVVLQEQQVPGTQLLVV